MVTPLADACAFVAPPNLRVAASIPVKAVPLPTKLVAVQIPVTIKPSGAVGAPLPALFFILSARIIEIVLLTLFYIYTTPNW